MQSIVLNLVKKFRASVEAKDSHLIQFHTAHIFTHYFSTNHFNTILFHLLFKCSFLLRFQTKHLIRFVFSHLCYNCVYQ
jgi:hypothetical protein